MVNIISLLTESVFPEPVEAIPTRSLPLRAIGQPCAWIGVGYSNPIFLESRQTLNYKLKLFIKNLSSHLKNYSLEYLLDFV